MARGCKRSKLGRRRWALRRRLHQFDAPRKSFAHVPAKVACCTALSLWWRTWDKCRDPGSNWGPPDLQSDALPTELSRQWWAARCTQLRPASFQAAGAKEIYICIYVYIYIYIYVCVNIYKCRRRTLHPAAGPMESIEWCCRRTCERADKWPREATPGWVLFYPWAKDLWALEKQKFAMEHRHFEPQA